MHPGGSATSGATVEPPLVPVVPCTPGPAQPAATELGVSIAVAQPPGRIVPLLGVGFALALAMLALVEGGEAPREWDGQRKLSLELSIPPIDLEPGLLPEVDSLLPSDADEPPQAKPRKRLARARAAATASPLAWAEAPSAPLSTEAAQDPGYRLRTALAGMRPLLTRCYERGLRNRPSAGRLLLSLEIDPDGRVEAVSVLDDTVHDDEVRRCVVSRLRTARLPALGESVVAQLPLLLVPLDS